MTPTWSPNGHRIAFVSARTGNHRLFIYRFKTRTTRQIRLNIGRGWAVQHPAWSPHGARIAFSAQRSRDAVWRIFTVRPNGTKLRRLKLGAKSSQLYPSWSPDGRHIAYTRYSYFAEGCGAETIVTARPNGRDRKRRVGCAFGATWSPDGRQLTYTSDDSVAEGGLHVAILDLASGEVRAIASGTDPNWQRRPNR